MSWAAWVLYILGALNFVSALMENNDDIKRRHYIAIMLGFCILAKLWQ